MQLATECIVISLIYLETIMKQARIEIRNINWKPLVFTAILLASKFWEDISFWNIDYVDRLDLYPLKSINRMESEFLSLCNYNIYVPAELYSEYQAVIKEVSNPTQSKDFLRFKDPKMEVKFSRHLSGPAPSPPVDVELLKMDPNVYVKMQY